MPIISGGSTAGKISGVTVTGTAASGQVPVASSSSAGAWAFPPGFEIGYDQITSPVNVASTTEATSTTIITCAAHTFDGAAVLLTVYFPYLQNGSTAGTQVTVNVFEGATNLGRISTLSLTSGTLQEAVPCMGSFRFTPTAGSHTYLVTAFASSVTGTPQLGAGAGGTGAYMPAFARFTKV